MHKSIMTFLISGIFIVTNAHAQQPGKCADAEVINEVKLVLNDGLCFKVWKCTSVALDDIRTLKPAAKEYGGGARCGAVATVLRVYSGKVMAEHGKKRTDKVPITYSGIERSPRSLTIAWGSDNGRPCKSERNCDVFASAWTRDAERKRDARLNKASDDIDALLDAIK